ncbi:hypothetical protein L3Q82_007744 [Scortum barcoo]|uniref:Uncharacterized protein n=1 Tax=Scortum barcoo TaxID=214431 RepID=A0ACB8WPL3_9TELE|nr:hypothetical protein L3Q82_007744 [Scortum barcoo]
MEDGTLRITNISKSDGGRYTCVARNHFGTSSSTGTLVVKEPTKIIVPPLSLDASVGQSLVLPCEVSSDSSLSPIFKWFFNGKAIDFSRQEHFEMIGGGFAGDLMVRNIQLKHSGKYVCMVHTEVDTVSAAADLIVRGPPGAPEGLVVTDITNTTVQLSWSSGPDNHSPVTVYMVQARTPFSIGWQTVRTVPKVAPVNVSGGGGARGELVIMWEPVPEEQQSGEDFGYVVAFRPLGSSTWIQTVLASPDASRYIYRNDSIAPLSQFEVKVGVYNSMGEGPFSHVVRVFSAEEEPSEAPARVWARAVSASEIEVYWEPIPPGSSSEKIVAYEKRIRDHEAEHPQRLSSQLWSAEPGKLSYASANLSHQDTLAPEGSPCMMANEYYLGIGSSVLFWETGSQQSEAERVRVINTAALLTGLKGSTLYLISVRAQNSAGLGPCSPALNITTKKPLCSRRLKSTQYKTHFSAAPDDYIKADCTPSQPPGNIEWSLTNSKIFLNWEHVKAMENESEVTGYKVLYRQNWHGRTTVLGTNKTSVELQIPSGEDYLIEIKALTEGGDGTSSGPIRIPKMSTQACRETLYKCRRHSGAVASSVASQQESSEFGPTSKLGPSYVEFAYYPEGFFPQSKDLQNLYASKTLRPSNRVRKNFKKSLYGKKKKPEEEPQMRDPSPWDGQTCNRCHMYREHHHQYTEFMGLVHVVKVSQHRHRSCPHQASEPQTDGPQPESVRNLQDWDQGSGWLTKEEYNKPTEGIWSINISDCLDIPAGGQGGGGGDHLSLTELPSVGPGVWWPADAIMVSSPARSHSRELVKIDQLALGVAESLRSSCLMECLRREKQCSANTVYSAGGELLTSTGDIVGWWKEYFEDLLNPTDMPSTEEAEAGDSKSIFCTSSLWVFYCGSNYGKTLPKRVQTKMDSKLNAIHEGLQAINQQLEPLHLQLHKLKSELDYCDSLETKYNTATRKQFNSLQKEVMDLLDKVKNHKLMEIMCDDVKASNEELSGHCHYLQQKIQELKDADQSPLEGRINELKAENEAKTRDREDLKKELQDLQ